MTARGFFVFIIVIALMATGSWLFFRAEGKPPVLSAPAKIVMGASGGEWTIGFVDADAGLKHIRVVAVHDAGELALAQTTLAGEILRGGSVNTHEVQVILGPEQVATLGEAAKLRIEATDWSLFMNLTQREVPIEIDRVPPRVEVHSGLTYVRHGGSGAVAYRVSDDATQDGVQVGKAFFPGYPKPGAGPGERVALFAIPADAPRDPEIEVVAEDVVGNRARAGWAVVPQYKELPEARIELDKRFIERVLPRFGKAVPEQSDALAKAFDGVNTELRAANERSIRENLLPSDASLILGNRLDQMTNSQVTSRFGERRSYFFEGKRISGATHYGYDLAATAGSPITAAGGGRIAFAGELGIYGNCVLIDHGMGLSTLYGHLSRIDVAKGDTVEQNQALGRSGATGLAGGDHLHFAVLVGGVYVDPIEWWDPKWVKSHIRVAL